jgi:hypothetical protein
MGTLSGRRLACSTTAPSMGRRSTSSWMWAGGSGVWRWRR